MQVEARMRTAACSCRGVELVLAGEPRRVYACSCLECQRCTGSAFSYRAIYADSAIVSQKGETRTWRRTGTSGPWLEQEFCTTCGSVVLMRAEALKDAISVSAGCLEDRDFPAPQLLHWAQRKHRWLCLQGIDVAAPA
ncbi:aldehyde-activating protein [Cupriavidus gilardii]|uniref:GFA family protein n=1 Tax=Cupriavidus gilardii TaxID=82541 RepID=UPI001EE59F08|nr:GFA family protein [Cupriavidus gilardii]MCG5258680.1 GFA family protein [Cupriavidus gilardii]MDF9429200.1 aldehyde-activating protein [Cupriavidus gilardii]